VECHVICLRAEGPVAADLRKAGASVHALGLENGTLHSALSFGRIVRLLRELRPDVVQTWLYHADLIGGLAARLVGVENVVWNIRSVELPQTAGALTRGIVKVCSMLSSRVPTRIICCSELARRVHERRGYDARRLVVIPNGVDVERFTPSPEARIAIRNECGVPEDAPLIGLIARLDPLKNHALFFAAAKKLHEANPRAHFLLAGKGIHDGTPAVRRWSIEAGVEHVTHLLGERSDIERVAASLDVGTCCSSSEAFPNALAEAMACAVPCVTTDVGDASAIVGDTGHVVPVEDADALANAWRAILALPSDERHRLGAAARDRVQSRFEIKAVTEQYLQLYDSLVPVRRNA
jgi:glycosyltransferase involved in cell wall biosynthesis